MPLVIARRLALGVVAATLAGSLVAPSAWAQKQYDTGASDTEIKIGNTNPYSGPASAYGTIGKAMAGWFAKVNAEGGVNGRKINFITADDAYNPAQTVEQVRKLVEQEQVLLVFGSLGTAQNVAVSRYMNQRKVPQLFVNSGASRFGDPKQFPWTMGWQPPYNLEGKLFARHILETRPNAKVAVLMQNDDFGKDYYNGVREGFGDKAEKMIVVQQTYEVTDPTIDSQLVALKASGADTFIDISTPKFAAQAIKKVAEIGWKPVHYLVSVSLSLSSVMKPAGLDNAVGVISGQYLRDPSDADVQGTKELADYLAFVKQYLPGADPSDTFNVNGMSEAQTMVQVLKQCGDNLTRDNVMKQAANLKLTLPMLLPGIEIVTSPTDYRPIEQKQLVRFDGKRFAPLGKPLGG